MFEEIYERVFVVSRIVLVVEITQHHTFAPCSSLIHYRHKLISFPVSTACASYAASSRLSSQLRKAELVRRMDSNATLGPSD